MSEMNWKSWILAAIVVVGLLFEVFKHVPVGTATGLWNKDGMAFSLGNSQPYAIREMRASERHENVAATHPLPRARVAALIPHLKEAVADNTPHTTDFDHKKDQAAKKVAKKKKDDDDEWEYFTDPVTGKHYRRRKKKAVAKQDDSTPVMPPKPNNPPADADASESPGIGGSGMPQTAGGAAALPNPTDPNAILQEWQQRMLSQANPQLTKQFIQAYQTNQISADVFYQIVQMMLEDSRTDIKQQGVICAEQTPSVMSFQLLADAEKQNAPGSPLRTMLDGGLNQYANLSGLGILKSVLSSTDTYAVAVAAQKVAAAAQMFLQPVGATTASGGTVSAQNTVTANASRFSGFLSLLLPLTKSPDASVHEYATQAYQDLQQRLNSVPTSAATTAANETPVP